MTEFPQRQIGRIALRVTELGLGCATLGGSQIAVARATAEEIVGAGSTARYRHSARQLPRPMKG
jgi:aryl-alcohol dehydrogenase-like predicted oxidoreductase